MSKSKEIRLSPSRINSINDCSWQYWASYHIRLPRTGNDGSKRGTVCHAVLESLVKLNHRHYVKKIIKKKDVFSFPSVSRYINILCDKENLPLDQKVVNLQKNGLTTHRIEINNMILVALENNFLGKPGDEILTEIRHTVQVNKEDKSFNLLGVIDKVLITKNKKGEVAEVEIIDYKTSSKKFKENDIESNLQALVYQFFAKKMFPDVKKIKFSFLFLRFPDNPLQEAPPLPDENINGFEHYLSYITKYMSSFTEEQAKKNFAKNSFSTKFLCGLYGKKKYKDERGNRVEHDEPQFVCSIRDPFEYYAVIDEDGNNIRSAMTQQELHLQSGEVSVKRKYLGCPAWHAQQKHLKRDWSVLQ